MKRIWLLILLVVMSRLAQSARILGLFPYPGKSHFIMFDEVMKTLAARGHEVTVYSHFPQKKPVPNLKDVSLVGATPTVVNAFKLEDSFGKGTVLMTLSLLESISVESCSKTLEFPAMQELMKSNEKYDLIFTEAFNSDCMLPFVHKFQAPNIAMCSSIFMPWTPDRFGQPDNPSYIPIQLVLSSDHMSFYERLTNTVAQLYSKWYFYTYIDKPINAIVKSHFGESLPPLYEIAKNTSLIFLNTNPVLNLPKPLVPAVVEVGGIHLQPAKKLPKDIEKFINEAEHGVIYFTFGSTVRAETFPADKRKALLDAFAELPQRVIWKWEAEDLPGKPPNVMIQKWLPQYDILSHPKTRAFITHGGLMGTIEALYNGVPLLVMPLFGDQPANAMACVERGVAVYLPFSDISKDSVFHGLKTLVNDPGYKARAEKLAFAYKDTPLSPRDTVIYWSEYVIRHSGAAHLRSAAVDLTWYQYLLLDVIAALFILALVTIVFITFLARFMIRHMFMKSSSIKSAPQHKKPKQN